MRALGFTGTRVGMTAEQIARVDELTMFDYDEVHHGDCVGADHDMHRIAKANGQRTVVHPPTDPRLRAWCDADVVLPEHPYLFRNQHIVDAAVFVIATPKESAYRGTDGKGKGGTWFTVDYARSTGKPGVIVWPDGSVVPL